MSEQVLNEILDELRGLKQEVGTLNKRVDGLESRVNDRFSGLESDMQGLKKSVAVIEQTVADVPLIRRAVLELSDTVKRMDASQQQTTQQLQSHDYAIEILNRRQLKLEAEVELLKRK